MSQPDQDPRGVLEAVDIEAPSLSVEAGSQHVALSDYWRGRSAVLVFLRHFG